MCLNTIFQEIVNENYLSFRIGGQNSDRKNPLIPSKKELQQEKSREYHSQIYSSHIKDEQIQQAPRKKYFKYQETTVRITQNFTAFTKKKRKSWDTVFHKAKEIGL